METNPPCHDLLDPCPHAGGSEPKGFALITMNEEASEASSVAQVVCASLDVSTLQSICRFDLGAHSELLVERLTRHQAAVVVNAGHNGSASGTISLMDVGTLFQRGQDREVCHKTGQLLMSELQKTGPNIPLPSPIILFSIETGNGEQQALSANKERGLSANLAVVVTAVLDTMRRNSCPYTRKKQ